MQNMKYAIVALVFISIVKIMQVTLFDAAKYNKNKKESFSKAIEKRPQNAKSSDSANTKKTSPAVLSEADVKVENDQPKDTTKSEIAINQPNTSNDNPLSTLKNTYLAPIVSKLPSGHLREDVVLRYYRHDKDGDKVYSLRDLGYYIHEKEATETAGLGSNVIYYGEDVKIEDIRIVALILLEKGIPLKSIQRSRYDWKSNSIEIGTDLNILDKTSITVDYILHFRK